MGPCRFRVIFDVVIHVVVPGRSLDSSTAVIKSTAIAFYRKARINVCICCRCYDRLLEALNGSRRRAQRAASAIEAINGK